MNALAPFRRDAAVVAGLAALAACSMSGWHQIPASGATGTAFRNADAAYVATRSRKLKVLYDFEGGADGAGPTGGLFADSAGNFYGITSIGGSQNSFCGGYGGCGTVYELARSGKRYSEKVVYAFNGPPDGASPQQVNLIGDKTGALYGTTLAGGTGGGGAGLGTVFKVTPSGAESVLYSFTSNDGGGGPVAGVVADARGNLYGTTFGFASSDNGAVYELKRSGGSYTEKVLHLFENNGSDGRQPWCALVIDRRGAVYGTTSSGGTYGFGTVFKLTPAHGSYAETVLYSFGQNANDGKYPDAGLVAGKGGVFYGTTGEGGATGNGTVFKLSGSGKSYSESIVYSFGASPDGSFPESPLLLEHGELYGTTFYGGGGPSVGTIFKVSATGHEKVLHSFTGGSDGGYPYAGLLVDSQGYLIGAASGAGYGSGEHGSVFEIR